MRNSVSELAEMRDSGKITREEYWSEIGERLNYISEMGSHLKGRKIELQTENGEIWVSVDYLPTDKSVKMLLDPNDQRNAPISLVADGPYEDFQAKVLFSLINVSDTFYDIGANMGFYSLCAAVLNQEIKILSFEPNPDVYKILQINIAKNKLDNIKALHFGLGSEMIENIEMYIPPITGTSGGSFINLHPEEGESHSRQVEIKTVDYISRHYNFGPDLCKIDVEGYEYSVLEGATETLSQHRPTIVIELLRKWLEPFGHHPQDIVKMLNLIGYKGYAIANTSLVPILQIDASTVETNFVFVHNSKTEHQKIISQFIA